MPGLPHMEQQLCLLMLMLRLIMLMLMKLIIKFRDLVISLDPAFAES